MGILGFGKKLLGKEDSDTYSRNYLLKLSKEWGIDAEAGHMINKGVHVEALVGIGQYRVTAKTDFEKLEFEKAKLTRSFKKHS